MQPLQQHKIALYLLCGNTKRECRKPAPNPKKYKQPKNSYTIRQTKNGTSFTSRTKVGNTTLTQTRTAKGKHKTTRTTKNANITNMLQY